MPGGETARLDLGSVVPRRGELRAERRGLAGTDGRRADRPDRRARCPATRPRTGCPRHRSRRPSLLLGLVGGDPERTRRTARAGQPRHRRGPRRAEGGDRGVGVRARRARARCGSHPGSTETSRSPRCCARRSRTGRSGCWSTASGPVTATLRSVRRRRPRRTPRSRTGGDRGHDGARPAGRRAAGAGAGGRRRGRGRGVVRRGRPTAPGEAGRADRRQRWGAATLPEGTRPGAGDPAPDRRHRGGGRRCRRPGHGRRDRGPAGAAGPHGLVPDVRPGLPQ